jgi:hypothetical protein
MARVRTLGPLVTASVIAFAAPRTAQAQVIRAPETRPRDSAFTRLVVRVADSSGVRLSDVSLTVIRSLRDTIAVGATDSTGVHAFFIPSGSKPYQLVLRKIGFARLERFFMANRDSVDLGFRMGRVVQALATVKVTEREDAVRKSYFIDADEIAASDRPLFDGADILTKLKPDMIFSRGGCPSIQNVWVNGVAVFKQFVQSSGSRAPRTISGTRNAQRNQPYIVSDMAVSRASTGGPAGVLGAARITMLEGIKPEHIEQITYKDCYDTSIRGNFGQNAVFIVLKPGIKFEPNVGSYAVDGGRNAR